MASGQAGVAAVEEPDVALLDEVLLEVVLVVSEVVLVELVEEPASAPLLELRLSVR